MSRTQTTRTTKIQTTWSIRWASACAWRLEARVARSWSWAGTLSSVTTATKTKHTGYAQGTVPSNAKRASSPLTAARTWYWRTNITTIRRPNLSYTSGTETKPLATVCLIQVYDKILLRIEDCFDTGFLIRQVDIKCKLINRFKVMGIGAMIFAILHTEKSVKQNCHKRKNRIEQIYGILKFRLFSIPLN